MKVGKWSTNAGSNNATPPDGWPEGQAPSTVNDCAREMMAAIRVYLDDAQYFDTGNTPSFLTSTTFSLGAADSDFHIGRRVKLFDATTLYGTIDSVSSTFVSVRLDSGALTTSLSSVALAIISEQGSSLPTPGRAKPNALPNGNLTVWQRGTTRSFTASEVVYLADGCFIYSVFDLAGAGGVVSRAELSAGASNVPTFAQVGMQLQNSMNVVVNATGAFNNSATHSALFFPLEGYDWATIAHKPNMVSFWVNTNKSGIYSCALRNMLGTASPRSVVHAFTVDTVNTWQKFTFTSPAAPATPSVWNYQTTAGVFLCVTLAAGSAYKTATLGDWSSQDKLAATGQVNFFASVGNAFAIAGIKLEEGMVATPLQPDKYQDTLDRCQRYCTVLSIGTVPYIGGGLAIQPTIAEVPYQYPVEMRLPPSVTFSTVANFRIAAQAGGGITVSAIAATTGTRGMYLTVQVQDTAAVSLTAGQCTRIALQATNVITIQSEMYP